MLRLGLATEVTEVDTALAAALEGLDPDDVTAEEALRTFEALERIVRRASAGRTLLARRVDDSMQWKRLGYASAAEFLAARSGTSLGAAKTEMETSRALAELPTTRARLLDGTISPAQGGVIAGAARANPTAEAALLDKARRANLNELRDEAARARAAADPDPEATHARIHRARRGHRHTDAEGARHLHLVGPVDLASVIEAELDRLTDTIFRAQARAGACEPREAYVYDAAAEMARRSARADDAPTASAGTKQPRPEHLALLRLDIAALRRGHIEGDELCEITGLGPIPVAAARRLLGDAVLKLIITNGVDVANVTSLTRGPTQAMRYALLWTSPTCTVEGCTRTVIEHDHRTGAEYKDTRHTRLDELDRVCTPHHDLHTLQGWALVPGTGKRPMVPPDDPRHPKHRPRGDPSGDPDPPLFDHPAA